MVTYRQTDDGGKILSGCQVLKILEDGFLKEEGIQTYLLEIVKLDKDDHGVEHIRYVRPTDLVYIV